jgi:transcriptional regulator with XRE-family HTH domain
MDAETTTKLHRLVGSRIREARTGKYSQEQLAEKLNLKRTTITSLERGNHQVGLDTLWVIADKLGLVIQDLLPKPEELSLSFDEIVDRTLKPSEKKWYYAVRSKNNL